jgi:hypothetical protein
MTLVQDRNGRDNQNDAPEVGDSLRDDWLGLAAYLADAIAGGDVTLDAARTELAAAGPAEHRALGRAADLAEARLGAESLVTTLLRDAAAQARPASV